MQILTEPCPIHSSWTSRLGGGIDANHVPLFFKKGKPDHIHNDYLNGGQALLPVEYCRLLKNPGGKRATPQRIIISFAVGYWFRRLLTMRESQAAAWQH